MRKKLFFLTVLASLVSCLLLFCGCMGGGGGDPIKSVSVTLINNEYEYDEETNVLSIDYEQRTSVNLTPSDFQLTLTYESGSSKTLRNSEYVVELSQESSLMQPNSYYTVYFKYAAGGGSIASVRLYVEPVTLPTIAYEGSMSFPYTGEEYDVVAELDKLQPSGQKTVSELLEEGALVLGEGSTTKATGYKASGYTLKLKPSSGFFWATETADELVISWQIDRIKILIPTFETEVEYKYEFLNGEIVGVEQRVEPDFGEYEGYVQYSGVRVGTEPFEYRKSFWISLKERYAESCVLYDGEQEYPAGYEVRWRIVPKSLPTVALKTSEFTYAKPSVNALGEGNSNLLNFDPTFMEIDYKNSDTFLATAGNGKIRILLKEELRDRFAFERSDDENISLGDGYADLNYSVLKGTFTPFAEVDFSKLEIETTYSSDLTLSKLSLVKTEISSLVAWTDEAWEYLKELGFVTDETNGKFSFAFLENSEELLNADEYPEVELTYHHYGESYEPYPLKANVLVKKLTIKLDWSDGVSSELTDGKHVYSASAAPVSIGNGLLNVLKYAQEECGATIECRLEYEKEIGATPTSYRRSLSEYEENDFSAYMIDVGKYKLLASVECDDNHLVSIDGGEATKQGLATFEFSIEKFVTDVRLVTVNNNLSENSAFYAANDDAFYYKQGQSVALNLTAWKEANSATNGLLAQLRKESALSSITSLVKQVREQKTYYREGEQQEWSIATDTTKVGYYKTAFAFTPVNENVQVNDASFEWRICSNEIVFETYDLVWEEFGLKTYSAKIFDGPKIVDLPENVLRTKYESYLYSDADGEPLDAINVGTYLTKMSILIPNDGSVTVSYPLEMFLESQTDDFKIYTYAQGMRWFINEYVISNYDFEMKLEQNLFVWDDTDKTVKISVDPYGESAFCLAMKAFLEKSVIVFNETAKVASSYVAKIQFPSGAGGENFDFNYDSFKGAEGYSYDSTTGILTLELPWSIVRA